MPLINVVELSKERCQYPILAKLKYATSKNFVGRCIDGYEPGLTDIALMTKVAAEKLCDVQVELNKKGYGLIIYDAYRPKQAVRDFVKWSKQPAENDYELQRKNKHYPDIEKNQLFELGYVAEDSGHCYGNTVDVFLVKVPNQKLNMGTRFDYMGKLSHISVDPSKIGKEAVQHRKILSEAMDKFKFEPLETEYWHFSYGGKEGREVREPLNIPITKELKQDTEEARKILRSAL